MGYSVNDMSVYLLKINNEMLEDFKNYCIEHQFYQEIDSVPFHQWVRDNLIADNSFIKLNHWNAAKSFIEDFQQKVVSSDYHVLACLNLSFSLLNAITYLQDKELQNSVAISESRRQFLEEQVKFLDTLGFDTPLPKDSSTTPSSQNQLDAKGKSKERKKRVSIFVKNVGELVDTVTEDAVDKVGNAVVTIVSSAIAATGDAVKKLATDKEVQKLLDSNEFQAIKDYAENILKNDQRSHTSIFGDGTVIEKHRLLSTFIKNIENAPSPRDLQIKLQTFYKGEDEEGSPYEVLNTHQDFLSSLLPTKTTTLKKIDDFKDYVENAALNSEKSLGKN